MDERFTGLRAVVRIKLKQFAGYGSECQFHTYYWAAHANWRQNQFGEHPDCDILLALWLEMEEL